MPPANKNLKMKKRSLNSEEQNVEESKSSNSKKQKKNNPQQAKAPANKAATKQTKQAATKQTKQAATKQTKQATTKQATTKQAATKQTKQTKQVKKLATADFGVIVQVQKEICYNADKSFFDNFKGAKKVMLGNKFFVEYASRDEARTKAKVLSGKKYGGKGLVTQVQKVPKSFKNSLISAKSIASKKTEVKKDKNSFPFTVVLSGVPSSANVGSLKALYPDSGSLIRLKRKKKPDGSAASIKKSFVVKYSSKAKAEADCKRSQSLTIDGKKFVAELRRPQNTGAPMTNGTKPAKSAAKETKKPQNTAADKKKKPAPKKSGKGGAQ